MGNTKEVADVFDEWVQTLTPLQKRWCREAVKNATDDLKNVGVVSAKELIVSVLLFFRANEIG